MAMAKTGKMVVKICMVVFWGIVADGEEECKRGGNNEL
jgi:hypothetical protein